MLADSHSMETKAKRLLLARVYELVLSDGWGVTSTEQADNPKAGDVAQDAKPESVEAGQ